MRRSVEASRGDVDEFVRLRGEAQMAREPNGAGSSGELPGGEVLVYQSPDGQVRVDVRVGQETVWLTQAQIAKLFRTTAQNIVMHLKTIFGDGELDERATCKDFLQVRSEGSREVRRRLKHFNLDAILSVGYRVNSRQGTQFRIWATRTLREHLLQGYTLHERRLRERGLGEMEAAVALLARTLTRHELVTDEGRAVLDVVHRYARAWRWLRAVKRQACLGRSVAISLARSWATSSRRSAAGRSTRVPRRAPPISCTSSSRTTLSRMATSASALSFFWSTFAAMDCWRGETEHRGWRTTR
jgi:hypothetical protein